MEKKLKIYIASPFFNEKEIQKVKEVKNILNEAGFYNLYIPMEHEPRHLNNNWEKKAYNQDIEAIEDCDALCAIYYGNVSDSGTAFEIGYAKALGKPIAIINMTNESNLMITQSATSNFDSKFDHLDKTLLKQT